MFFFHTLCFGVLTFGFALSYIVTVETKRLTEAKIMERIAEWIKNFCPVLDCPTFKGVLVLELHIDVANGSCVIHQVLKA